MLLGLKFGLRTFHICHFLISVLLPSSAIAFCFAISSCVDIRLFVDGLLPFATT